MQIARLLLCLLSVVLAISARAQIIEPRSEIEKVLVESVKRRLSACFTVLGVAPEIPVALKRPPDNELLAAVLLGASGSLMNDGYNYMLLIHITSNSAFVVQFGGFAGSQAIFGPISLQTTCQ